jgi:hypothetical protein
LREEFVFLAVVLDADSRRVVGLSLDQTLAPPTDPTQQLAEGPT